MHENIIKIDYDNKLIKIQTIIEDGSKKYNITTFLSSKKQQHFLLNCMI